MATRRETMALIASAAAFGGSARAVDRTAACLVGEPLDAVARDLLAHLPETVVYNGTPARAACRHDVARPRGGGGVGAAGRGRALRRERPRAGLYALTPAEIHRVGLAEVARIGGELDRRLRRRGLSRGSVGARLVALARDQAQRFADGDAGRVAALDYARGLIRVSSSSIRASCRRR